MQTLVKHINEAIRQTRYCLQELGTQCGYLEVVECNVGSELLGAINKAVASLPLEARFTLCQKLAKAYFIEYGTYNIFESFQAHILYHFSEPNQFVLEAIALAAWHGVNIFGQG